MDLETIRHGDATDGTPLLLVHGLFGSARNWGAIARRLADTRRVWTVDMRNHGASPRAERHGYEDMAADLADVIAAQGGPVDVMGHSMGGKAAMVLALTQPALVRRLVVADIAPVAYGHSQAPLIQAMRGLDLRGLDTRAEADRRLANTVADRGVRAFLLQSLDLRANPPRWRLNLDVLEAEMDRIIGWPGIDGRFDGRFDGHALFLSGGASDYVRAEHRPLIRTLFPQARFARIPGAGHWLHAEKPREFAETLRAFLDAPGADAAQDAT
ncbi:MAG: alpha/beta fold hydrolase [Rhodobacteraceae bacterium]|nr:alpha/beta fold hydrolase [Paracoccaceae bacterium]